MALPNYYSQVNWAAKFNPENDSNWIDLGGVMYNKKTGETGILGSDGKTPDYYYNPEKSHTLYGGQQYSGKLDPYVLGSLGNEDFEATSLDPYIKAYTERAENDLNKYAFFGEGDTGATEESVQKRVNDWWSPKQGVIDALSMGRAYNDALGKYQGSSFFDQVGAIDFNKTDEESGRAAIEARDDLPPAVKAAILGKQQPTPSTSVPKKAAEDSPLMTQYNLSRQTYERYGNPVQQSTVKASTYSPMIETPQQSQPATPAVPQTSQPSSEPEEVPSMDWKGLYDQLSSMINKKSTNTSTTGSFFQFSPTTSYTPYQTSYTRNTGTSSGKGA